jgi:hypothetical protein
MQVINDTNAGGRLGAMLGTGLQELAQNKLAMIQQQYNQAYNQNQYAQGVGKLFERFGVAPEKALEMGRSMYMLSPQERNLFWQNPGAWLGQQQEQPQTGIGALQQTGQPQPGMNILQQQMPQQMQEPESIQGPYMPYNPNLEGPQGVAPQQAQAMPQPQQQDRAKQIAESFMSPQEKRQQRMVELAEHKEENRRQEKLKPFVEKMQNEDARWQTIRDKASTALSLLEKAKAKFPGYFTGNVPESMSSWVIRDPDVREYQGLINDLIPLLASEPGQRLTNMQLKLKQMAKANVSQPIQTQAALLNGILDQSNERKAATDYMESLRNQETGDFPKDLSSRVTEFRHAQEDPLKYPKYFRHNTIIEDDQGNIHMNINGKRWQQIKR